MLQHRASFACSVTNIHLLAQAAYYNRPKAVLHISSFAKSGPITIRGLSLTICCLHFFFISFDDTILHDPGSTYLAMTQSHLHSAFDTFQTSLLNHTKRNDWVHGILTSTSESDYLAITTLNCTHITLADYGEILCFHAAPSTLSYTATLPPHPFLS